MIFRYFLFLTLLLSLSGLSAQTDSLDVIDYSQRNTYEIGGIEVTGAESRDRNAIKSIAGFSIGKKIQIPGPDIPKAIKSLYRLRLFEDVQIIQTKTLGDVIFLEIILAESPVLSRYSYSGVKKSNHDELNDIVTNIINKGSIVTADQKNIAAQKIKEYYVGKGKLDTKVSVVESEDELKPNTTKLEFKIDLGDKVKVENITFVGNEILSGGKLRKAMESTKRKGTLFKKSKFIKSDYKLDKELIVDKYNKLGYRDARIVGDTVIRNSEGNIEIEIHIDEGDQYYFGDIEWNGNTKYTDDQLNSILGIAKGDVYNPELLENRLRFSQDGRDVSSFYLDDGYLFFDVQPVEKSIINDTIDIDMRIYEGAQATIENVTIEGNDRTNEHVVRRILRTKPGRKFSRSDIVRSQREIINLGYFNPEALGINTPVNPTRGTVDIEYQVEERPSDQLELSAGYGGASGLIGTLGVTFNNFSAANIKNRETWSPLPQGDGQKLSLRIQSNSRFFRSYNFTFTEPWLGGKKPNSFTIGAVRSSFDYTLFNGGSLAINRFFIGLGTQLKWPDDFFSRSTTLTLETINLSDYQRGQFFVKNEDGNLLNIDNGNFKNFSIKQVISRSSVSEPIYPRRGSRFSLSMQFTPPYSLFRSDDFDEISSADQMALIEKLEKRRGPGNPPTDADIASEIEREQLSRKFEYLEYHKWRFDAETYFNLFGNVVLAASAKIGYLGAYDNSVGISPFERFELGGDGLSNQNAGIVGKDIISLRGYEVEDLPENSDGGATLFDKFTLEMRFPLSLNPTTTIYFTSFLQGGNSWASFDQFNPFDINRSAGVGMRVFLPMFGLLGFDYGYGFDQDLPDGSGISSYGQFNIVLGFEPD